MNRLRELFCWLFGHRWAMPSGEGMLYRPIHCSRCGLVA